MVKAAIMVNPGQDSAQKPKFRMAKNILLYEFSVLLYYLDWVKT